MLDFCLALSGLFNLLKKGNVEQLLGIKVTGLRELARICPKVICMLPTLKLKCSARCICFVSVQPKTETLLLNFMLASLHVQERMYKRK